MVCFREALDQCQLYDLGFRGDMYTWSDKHEDDTYTKERLDRVVANPIWKMRFSNYVVEGLVTRCSDHKPLLMHFDVGEEVRGMLESCGNALGRWNRQKNSKQGNEVKLLSGQLKKLQDNEDQFQTSEVKNLQLRQGVLLEQEDVKWRQQAKRNWYKGGDSNTSYFHAYAT
ncbi:uncharacterized protein LOC122301395 [Carya illinoinensis]|uniref:uncharacterized protein LOC122301395 n=1 Tax=Carya illinoinensis TaxID=32201 RepID=UPI001C71AD9D|nr:uncharacterized protein LOC122301395 [Carya illinoinensis]